MFTGYLNYFFRRKKFHPKELINVLFLKIQSLEYDLLIISGDLTNVSAENEFSEARKILSPVLDSRAFMIPGNHDRYMESAILPVDLFDKNFKEFSGIKITEDKYIRVKQINDFYIIGWDSNRPTGVGIATGYVEPDVVTRTFKFLKENKIQKYIIVCHHPIWKRPDKKESSYHKMDNREEIAAMLKSNPPIAYIHGHVHSNWIKFKSDDLPFHIINSASSSKLSRHDNECGFHYFELNDAELKAQRFVYNKNLNKFEYSNLITY